MPTVRVRDVVNRAFSKIRVRAVGQTLSGDESAHALAVLNDMVEEWAGENFMLYEQTEENFAMVSGQAAYSIGASGSPDFNTTRPQEIMSGTFIRDSSNGDYRVDIISVGQYRAIVTKTTASRPDKLAYIPTFPNGTIYLYPTPNSTESIYLRSLKELSEFATLATTVTLPPGYVPALISNLAVMLAPDYGKEVGMVLAVLAASSKAKIKRRNAQRQDPVRLEVARLGREDVYGNINNYYW